MADRFGCYRKEGGRMTELTSYAGTVKKRVLAEHSMDFGDVYVTVSQTLPGLLDEVAVGQYAQLVASKLNYDQEGKA